MCVCVCVCVCVYEVSICQVSATVLVNGIIWPVFVFLVWPARPFYPSPGYFSNFIVYNKTEHNE